MDDQTPSTPQQTTPEAGEQKPIVPDPHRGEPAPPAQQGMRPEAIASGILPEEDEPAGPLVGLVTASTAEVKAELTGDSGAEELLAMMGVEAEGIEAGQVGGIALAMFVSIFALAIVMYYLFYVPFRDQTGGIAESEVLYEELESIQTEGTAKLTQYARADSTYTLPIEAAMASVANDYAADGGTAEPRTRGGFNTTMLPPSGYSAARGTQTTVMADTVETMIGTFPVSGDDAMEMDEEIGADTPDAPTPE